MMHAAEVPDLAFTPDGELLVTCSLDNTARIWHVRTGKAIGPPLSHNENVFVIRVSPDGKWLATGGADGTAKIWRVPVAVREDAETIRQQVEDITGMRADDADQPRVHDRVR